MDDSPQDTSSSTPNQKPRFRYKWLILLILILLLAFLAIKIGLSAINNPVEGTIITKPKQAQPQPVQPPKQITTTYYTATYPSNYEQAKSPAYSASLDAQVLVAQQQDSIGTGSRITLTTTNLPAGGVSEDAAYKAFYAQTALYTVYENRRDQDVLITAERISPNYEQTILWPHPPYLLTITMVAATPSAILEQEVQTILKSLIWK